MKATNNQYWKQLDWDSLCYEIDAIDRAYDSYSYRSEDPTNFRAFTEDERTALEPIVAEWWHGLTRDEQRHHLEDALKECLSAAQDIAQALASLNDKEE